jgi:hypothetical protein
MKRTDSWLSIRVRNYMDRVPKIPAWQFPFHLPLILILYVISFVINQFNKEK